MKKSIINSQILLFILFFFISNLHSLKGQTPSVDFRISKSCKNIAIFDSSTYSGNYSIINQKVRFGDGTNFNSSIFNYYINHTYNYDSTYTVCYIVTFYDSATSSTFKDSSCKMIQINIDKTCYMTGLYLTLDSPNCKKIIAYPSLYFPRHPLTKHHLITHCKTKIDFGDGTLDSNNSYFNFNHTYSSEGSYTIKSYNQLFDTTTNQYYYDTVIRSINLICNPCNVVAYFNYSMDTSNNCYKVNFYGYNNNYTNTSFDFGDNNSSSSNITSHTYTSSGYYDVTYYVEKYDSINSKWCRDSNILTINVDCGRCGIKSNLYLSYDSSQTFKAKLYNFSSGPINKHRWLFGDGSSSNLKAPTHTYTNSGLYTLIYIAIDTINNCQDTSYINFEIDSFGNIKRGNISFTIEIIDRTIITTEIENVLLENKINLYPNPAKESFFIETKANSSISIFNYNGQKIYETNSQGLKQVEIKVTNWNKGLYICRINNSESIKFIVD